MTDDDKTPAERLQAVLEAGSGDHVTITRELAEQLVFWDTLYRTLLERVERVEGRFKRHELAPSEVSQALGWKRTRERVPWLDLILAYWTLTARTPADSFYRELGLRVLLAGDRHRVCGREQPLAGWKALEEIASFFAYQNAVAARQALHRAIEAMRNYLAQPPEERHSDPDDFWGRVLRETRLPSNR